jgi:WD40 repeat protein
MSWRDAYRKQAQLSLHKRKTSSIDFTVDAIDLERCSKIPKISSHAIIPLYDSVVAVNVMPAIHIFDIETCKVLKTIPRAEPSSVAEVSMCFHEAKKLLITQPWSTKELIVYDLDGQEVRRIQTTKVICGGRPSFHAFDEYILAACNTKEVVLWNITDTLTQVFALSHPEEVSSVIILNEKHIASATRTIGSVHIWDIETLTGVQLVNQHGDWVRQMITLDKNRFISGAWNSTIIIGDATNHTSCKLENDVVPYALLTLVNSQYMAYGDRNKVAIANNHLRELNVFTVPTEEIEALVCVEGKRGLYLVISDEEVGLVIVPLSSPNSTKETFSMKQVLWKAPFTDINFY